MLRLGSVLSVRCRIAHPAATAAPVHGHVNPSRVTRSPAVCGAEIRRAAVFAFAVLSLLGTLDDARGDEPPVRASIKSAAESHRSPDSLDAAPTARPADVHPLMLAPPSDQRDHSTGRQAEGGSSDSQLRRRGSWWTAGSLCMVLALFVIAVQLIRHRLPLAMPSVPREVLEPLGRCQLDAKQSVHLVRCGSQILLLGSSSAGLRSLGAVTDPEEVDRIAGLCRHARRSSAVEAFSTVFTRHASNESLEAAQGRENGGGTRPGSVALESLEESGEAIHA